MAEDGQLTHEKNGEIGKIRCCYESNKKNTVSKKDVKLGFAFNCMNCELSRFLVKSGKKTILYPRLVKITIIELF